MSDRPKIESPVDSHGEWACFYPCSEQCGFVGSERAFVTGACYQPCPDCGGERQPRIGRMLYKRVKLCRWLPFITVNSRVGIEWRDS